MGKNVDFRKRFRKRRLWKPHCVYDAPVSVWISEKGEFQKR